LSILKYNKNNQKIDNRLDYSHILKPIGSIRISSVAPTANRSRRCRTKINSRL